MIQRAIAIVSLISSLSNSGVDPNIVNGIPTAVSADSIGRDWALVLYRTAVSLRDRLLLLMALTIADDSSFSLLYYANTGLLPSADDVSVLPRR